MASRNSFSFLRTSFLTLSLGLRSLKIYGSDIPQIFSFTALLLRKALTGVISSSEFLRLDLIGEKTIFGGIKVLLPVFIQAPSPRILRAAGFKMLPFVASTDYCFPKVGLGKAVKD